MNLHKLIFTKNACYKAGRKITPKGIMVHSTGANNPNLKRYVGPNDGLLGENQYGNHWNQDKPDGREGCPTPWQAGRRLYRHPSGAALGLSRPALRLRLAGCADGRLHRHCARHPLRWLRRLY